MPIKGKDKQYKALFALVVEKERDMVYNEEDDEKLIAKQVG